MSPCWAFHWLHETFVSKNVCHHFWPGLIPLPRAGDSALLFIRWGTSQVQFSFAMSQFDWREQWTVHSPQQQTQLEKTLPLPLITRKKRGDPFTPCHDFSFVAWIFWVPLFLAWTK
jgi:hypothetical protein